MKKYIRFFFIVIIAAASLAPAGDALCARPARAKNIILMIGDGMGPAHFWAAQLFSNRSLKKDLNLFRAMKEFRSAAVVNYTADSMVTESAAAAGQMATGVPMTANAVSMAADGTTEVRTILEMLRKKGHSCGIVTTSGLTDATPAAFSAHVSNRYEEEDIAAQQAASGIEVLMGGRKKFFLPAEKDGERDDGRDLTAEVAKAGYEFVETAEGLAKAGAAGKILGLFNRGNMTWELTRARTKEPSLAEMTRKTLSVLSKNKKGFFAMIEGGRIDHASHNNDTAAMIRELIGFDEAVGAVMEFAEKNPDTLVLITADHETGGFAMVGCGNKSASYVGLDLEAIGRITEPLDAMCKKIEDDPRPETVMSVVKNGTGIVLSTKEAEIVSTDAIKKIEPHNYQYDFFHSLAFVMRPYTRAAWGSQTHTANPVFVIGRGPGSEGVKGIMHNTELFTLMKKAAGLK